MDLIEVYEADWLLTARTGEITTQAKTHGEKVVQNLAYEGFDDDDEVIDVFLRNVLIPEPAPEPVGSEHEVTNGKNSMPVFDERPDHPEILGNDIPESGATSFEREDEMDEMDHELLLAECWDSLGVYGKKGMHELFLAECWDPLGVDGKEGAQESEVGAHTDSDAEEYNEGVHGNFGHYGKEGLQNGMVCRHWTDRSCKYGYQCKFSHDGPGDFHYELNFFESDPMYATLAKEMADEGMIECDCGSFFVQGSGCSECADSLNVGTKHAGGSNFFVQGSGCLECADSLNVGTKHVDGGDQRRDHMGTPAQEKKRQKQRRRRERERVRAREVKEHLSGDAQTTMDKAA